MKIRLILGVVAAITCLTIGFLIGESVEKRRTARQDLQVSIPLNVMIYKDIHASNYSRAANHIGMILMGKLDKYDSFQNDKMPWPIRYQPNASPDFLRSVEEAKQISSTVRSNLILISPDK